MPFLTFLHTAVSVMQITIVFELSVIDYKLEKKSGGYFLAQPVDKIMCAMSKAITLNRLFLHARVFVQLYLSYTPESPNGAEFTGNKHFLTVDLPFSNGGPAT